MGPECAGNGIFINLFRPITECANQISRYEMVRGRETVAGDWNYFLLTSNYYISTYTFRYCSPFVILQVYTVTHFVMLIFILLVFVCLCSFIELCCSSKSHPALYACVYECLCACMCVWCSFSPFPMITTGVSMTHMFLI